MAFTVVDDGSQQMGDTWKPEKAGEFLQGVFVGSQNVETKKGPAVVFTVRDDAGQEHGVFGNFNTNKYFAQAPVGSYIILVFKGKVKTKRDNDVNTYAFAFDAQRPADSVIADFLSQAEADPTQMTKAVEGAPAAPAASGEKDDLPF